MWRDRSVGKGSLTYADGKLYLLGEGGVVGLAEASPTGYKEKSRFNIPRGELPTWTPPVISGGRLYLREQDNLRAGQQFEIKRLRRGDYRLVRREAPINEGLVDWLLSCPEKGFFVPIESESTDTL